MKFILRCLLLIALLVLPLSAGANTVCAVHACNETAESFSSEDESASLYSSLNMDMLYKTLTVSYADLSIKEFQNLSYMQIIIVHVVLLSILVR